MPQDPQLDPQYDYAKLPDGSLAKFPKGTNPMVMRARLTQAGLLKAPSYKGPVTPAKPDYQMPKWYGFTPGNVAKNVYEGAKGLVKGTADIGKDLLSNPNWFRQMPAGQRPSTAQKYIYEPADKEVAAAKKAYNEGRTSEAVGHGLAAALPMVGPWASSLGEQAGRGDVGGAVGQVAGAYAAGKVSHEVAKTAMSADALRKYAAKTNNGLMRLAEMDKKGYNLGAALQTAKQGIWGSIRKLAGDVNGNLQQEPGLIEQARLKVNAQKETLAKQLDAQGKTVDMETALGQKVHDLRVQLNQQGNWTPKVRDAVRGLIQRLGSVEDPQRPGTWIPRNLKAMKISEAIQIIRGLDHVTGFDPETQSIVGNITKSVRQAMNDAIGKVSPEMQELRQRESQLASARDAMRSLHTDVLNQAHRLVRGFIYSGNIPSIAAYFALRPIFGFGPALASVMTLRALWATAPSVTLRAALAAKMADILDPALNRITKPAGGTLGTTGLTGPLAPQGGPTGPQTQATPRLNAPAGAPFAPAETVFTYPPNAPSQWRGPAAPASLPERATRARSGSGDYVTPEKMEQAKRGPAGQSSPMADAQAALKADAQRGGASRSVVESNTKTAKPTKLPKALWTDAFHDRLSQLGYTNEQVRESARKGEASDLYESGKTSLEEAINEADRVSGKQITPPARNRPEELRQATLKDIANEPKTIDARSKAMLDRLDTIQNTKPTSGAHANALKRETEQIKGILSGQIKGADLSKANKQIADRERLQAKRAEAQSQTSTDTVASATQAGSAAMSMSPEQRMMIMEQAYERLSKFEGGPEYVKALKKQAADMRKAGIRDYDELNELIKAVQVLQQLEGK